MFPSEHRLLGFRTPSEPDEWFRWTTLPGRRAEDWRVKAGWRGMGGGLGMEMEGVDPERWTLKRRM